MKTITITGIMADFLDSIRAYEHESGKAIHFDERESSEFVDMYFNGGGKINIEESNADGENNQKQIMKTYRLKQWYPSLAISWRTGIRYEYDADRQVMTNISNVKDGVAMPKEMAIKEQELHPDFWELIEEKKPLFTTDDGVKCFDGDEYISIGHDFCMRSMRASNCDSPYSNDVVRFKNESNADQYIWRNKRVFSYEDFVRWGNVPYERVIKKLAMERSKE